VLGEVYWEAKVGDSNYVEDFIAPPLLVSLERDGKEVNASLSSYAEPEEVRAAFSLKKALPEPIGIFANQPNPAGKHIGWWVGLGAVFGILDLLLTMGLSAAGKESVGAPCCLTLPLLVLPAVVMATKWREFESGRWAESDHPWGEMDLSESD